MPKVTLYGQRWKIIGSLGEGGQGHVFRVVDVTNQEVGDFALKRVRNPHRVARFASEIEAIKRLAHPNIIKLIDHSALTDATTEERRYLVMPIAQGGDLSDPGRLSIYKGSVEAVLQVAFQLADALGAAHRAGIIHRDIKPENVLFSGRGHNVWVSDFGICLIRGRDRSTEEGEVVGPRAFMAPELEHGGRLEVTYSADVYSLGKLLFYMFSGGQLIAREDVYEPRYDMLFATGDWQQKLRYLLSRMIAPLERRLQSTDEVARDLQALRAWESNAHLPLASGATVAGFEALRRRSHSARQIAAADNAARTEEQSVRQRIGESFKTWLSDHLKLVESQLGSDENIEVAAGEVGSVGQGLKLIASVGTRVYAPLVSFELRIRMAEDDFKRVHRLRISLCEGPKEIVTAAVRVPGATQREQTAKPARDLQFAMMPTYFLASPTGEELVKGFLTKKALVGVEAEAKPSSGGGDRPVKFLTPAIINHFEPSASQYVEFRASEWLNAKERLETGLTEALAAFIDYIVSRK